MSNLPSPQRETVSSPSSSSALDSSTFYSIHDSDADDSSPNLSSVSAESMLSASDHQISATKLFDAADRTLTNLSQSTLNFILDETKQQQQNEQYVTPKKPSAASVVVTPATPTPVTPASDVVDKPQPVAFDPKPAAVPAAVQSLPQVPVSGPQAPPRPSISVPSTTPIAVDSPAPTPTKPKDISVIVLDDSTIIELSSDSEDDDPNSDVSVRTLNDPSLTDESLDSRSGDVSADGASGGAGSSNGELALGNVTSSGQLAPPASAAEVDVKMYKSVAEFEANLPKTVTMLQSPDGAKVYVVGTAHFSRESMDDVSLVIRNVRPDVVMVELCPSRIHILKHDEKTLLEEASNINLASVRNIVRQNGLINGLFYIVLLKMSAKLTQELGMAPGGEFRRALEEVHRLDNCILHLGDRPINITLQRAMHGLSAWQSLKIVWKLITSDEKISKEDVEKCKEADMIEELLQEMAGEYPEFRTVFVTERDLYLCHSLQVAATQHVAVGEGLVRPVTVVGVVGIGHMAGITQHWGKVNVDKIPEITTIPQPTRRSKVIKFAIKWTVVGAIGYGVYRAVGSPRLLPTSLPKLPSW